MSRINQGKGAFSFFLRQNLSFFFFIFSQTAQQDSPPIWLSPMALQVLTDQWAHHSPQTQMPTATPMGEAWEAKGPCLQSCWGPQEKEADPKQSGSNTISYSSWMKLRDVLGGKTGLGSYRKACPRLSPLVTSGGNRAICQKPTVTSETLLDTTLLKKLCSHWRFSKQKGMNQDAPSGRSRAWNAQAIPYAEAQICPLAEWQGQKMSWNKENSLTCVAPSAKPILRTMNGSFHSNPKFSGLS